MTTASKRSSRKSKRPSFNKRAKEDWVIKRRAAKGEGLFYNLMNRLQKSALNFSAFTQKEHSEVDRRPFGKKNMRCTSDFHSDKIKVAAKNFEERVSKYSKYRL